MRRSSYRAVLILCASFCFGLQRAYSCAVCFGDPEDPQTAGMNAAILTLLSATALVLASVAASVIVLWRRAVAFVEDSTK